jgi:hypothetical protein
MKYEYEILSAEKMGDWYTYFEQLEEKGIYHDPRYIALMAEHFGTEPELLIYGTDEKFVYYPYYIKPINNLKFVGNELDGYQDIISSWYYGGPLFSSQKKAKESDILKHFNSDFLSIRKENCIVSEFVRFDPILENYNLFDGLDPTFDRKTVPVSILKSEDQIWGEFESRNQRAIRQALDTDIHVEHTDDEKDFKAWEEIYSAAMEAKNAAKHYHFSYDLLRDLLMSNMASLLVARYKGEIIGGFMIAHDDKVAHHFLSASMPKYWDMRVNNLMFFKAIMFSKRKGRKIFDFQGGRPGVYKFKKGFSQDRGKFYVGNLIHDGEIYDELVQLAKDSGVEFDDGFFPKYRSR